MATEIFCASIHTLKLALAEKNQLKCIDNTIISDLRPANIYTTCNVSFVSLKQGSLILSLTQQTIYNNDVS